MLYFVLSLLNLLIQRKAFWSILKNGSNNVSLSSKRNRVQVLLAWVPPPSGTFKLNMGSLIHGSLVLIIFFMVLSRSTEV